MFDFVRDFWLWITRQGGGVPHGDSIGRKYHFPLPYKIGKIKVPFAINHLKKSGVWDNIPNDMKRRLQKSGWGDRLDNKTWTLIAKKLNLKWSK
jgi:hypothetical protein